MEIISWSIGGILCICHGLLLAIGLGIFIGVMIMTIIKTLHVLGLSI